MRRSIPRVLRVIAAFTIVLILVGSPRTGSADSGLQMLAGFPTLKQQHSLTCESSAASMGTRGAISEAQLMAVMPHHPNPNVGFRGNPDGVPGPKLTDYGVYAAPVQRALAQYGYNSTVLTYATRSDIKKSIDAGDPVVAWITYGLQRATPRLGVFNGVHFILVPHEHAVLVVGYDATTLFANDPWTGMQVRYKWSDFERSWGLFGNMALAMEPCAAPKQVKRVAIAGVSTAGIVWSWTRAKNAAQYGVTVTRHGTPDTVVFHGLVGTSRFTLPNPVPGASYEIAVRSVSVCGERAPAIREWYDVPSVLPTPVPSPTVIPTTSVTATARPAVSPTATVVPTPSPTAAH